MINRLLIVSALLLSFLLPYSASAAGYPVYDLKVKVFPSESRIEGLARIKIPADVKANFTYNNLKIEEIKINGKSYSPGSALDSGISVSSGEKLVEVRYSAEFKKPENKGTGMVLLSNWYPLLQGKSIYKLSVDLPAGYDAVSEYDTKVISVTKKGKSIKYKFSNPVHGITLVVGRYSVNEVLHKGIAVRTYFFKDDKELVSRYIQHTKRYLDMYVKMLGSYPFKSFNIVENSYQTGYSFPTYTLLGSRVIRLPFIVETSLGHEVLHQWFGSYVYTDYEKGNWAEGLTSYLADHWYKHVKGEGSDYRKKILINYDNYIAAGSEKSLREFRSGMDISERPLGYGKSAMVFHMLRMKLGDKNFFKGLREFILDNSLKDASWDDIKKAYSVYLKDSDVFFSQWVENKGIIKMDMNGFSVVFRDGRYKLNFNLEQDNGAYKFQLPLKVETDSGIEEFVLEVDKKSMHFERLFNSRPVKIYMDPEYHLMRNLSGSEKPPVISSVTGDSRSLLIIPDDAGEQKKYDYAVEFFKRMGHRYKSEKDTKNSDLIGNSVILLSSRNSIYRRLFADRKLPEAGLIIKVEKNPLNIEKAAMMINAENRNELVMALRKIRHYGSYSLLLFNRGNNIKKSVTGSQMGLVRTLDVNIDAIETKKTMGIGDVVEKIKNKQVVYVGEVHTSYSHHLVQFEIIKRLHKIHGKILIGMEMFQQPYQEYLDKYINSEIGEEEFLKQSEYFNRWSYDYNLYRDILNFARDKKIKVVALNLRGELVQKVSRQGIDALTPEEKKELPGDMDLTNMEYRESMLSVMKSHSTKIKMDFNNFFQAQILWDESMAHNAVKAMKENPGVPIVILAGNGHLQYSWGIPDRVKRLTGAGQSVILVGNQGDLGNSVADFILFPGEVISPEAPKLGVYLKDTSDGLLISKLVSNSIAMKAGMIKDDIIVSIDNREVKDISDLKIILLNRKKGDKINVRIKRKLNSTVQELVINFEL